PDRLAAGGDRLGMLPHAIQGSAEVVPGLGEVRLEPDRLAKGGDRVTGPPRAVQGDAEVYVGPCVVGLDAGRVAGGDARLAVPPQVVQDDAEIEMGGLVAGIAIDQRLCSGEGPEQDGLRLVGAAPILEALPEAGQVGGCPGRRSARSRKTASASPSRPRRSS